MSDAVTAPEGVDDCVHDDQIDLCYDAELNVGFQNLPPMVSIKELPSGILRGTLCGTANRPAETRTTSVTNLGNSLLKQSICLLKHLAQVLHVLLGDFSE